MARRPTPERFLGRRDQLAVLEDVLAAAHRGQGDVVLIGGEAGVGKSRLVGELAAAASRQGCAVLVGWCVEHGDQVSPLAPFADAVRDLATSTPPDELDEILDGVGDVLARLVPELDSSGQDLGEGSPPVGRLLDSVLCVLRRLSEHRPTVVVLEDLHWADESTRHLLAFLTPRLADRPVVFVLTYRSDEMHRRHPLRPFLRSLIRARPEHIELAAFTIDELADLVGELTGSDPDRGFVSSLYDRCGGNAFFAEELVAGGTRHNLPLVLRDVVLSRTDVLDDRQLMLLRAAAAAGPQIDPTVLAAVCDVEPVVVDSAVEALIDAGLWMRDGDRLRFRHELAREIIEAELVAGERAVMHGALAAKLADLAPQRTGQIAHHWSLAGNQPEALEASVVAGRAAMALGAHSEALLQFERALELWQRVPAAAERAGCSQSDLLLEAADAAGRARSFATATVHGRRAIADLAGGDPVAEGLACLQVVEWAWWAEGDQDDSKQLIERAVELIPEQPPSAARALAVAWQARLLADIGGPDAFDSAAEALALARSTGTRRAEIQVLITIGILRFLDGDPTGHEKVGAALAMALRDGNPLDICRAYFSLAFCWNVGGRHAQVVELEREAMEFCAASGLYRAFGALIELHVIWSLKHLGRWEAVETRVNELRDEFGDLRLEHLSLGGPWGVILVRQGRPAGVDAMIADDLARMHEHRHVDAPLGTTAVELAAAEGRFDDIAELVDVTLDRTMPRHVRHAAELVASAIGALADRPVPLKIRSRPATTEADRTHAETWIARIESAYTETPDRKIMPDVEPRLDHARIELSRWRGEPCSQRSAELAETWEELDAAYETAYTRWRLAEALLHESGGRSVTARAEAQSLLRAARRSASEMGAAPLVLHIETLARRARLNLNAERGSEQPAVAATELRFGLTDRELEVLHLVADGRSNGQIGDALYISRKTASVHVSNILRKLDVSSRLEAAAIATRSGLVTAD